MRNIDFNFLQNEEIYLDSACQTLRPQPVIEALNDYYYNYNACGERVKYDWGKKVDTRVDATRAKLLKLLKLSPRKYFVSFTANTTSGINLILSQLDYNNFDEIITSDIEHNSVFLPTITYAKLHNIKRTIIDRNADGSITLQNPKNAVYVFNAVSNIDGRKLENLAEITKQIHKAGGILIIDAAQTLGHYHKLLEKTDADFICFSAHKAYGASLGGVIANRDAVKYLKVSFIGGGMVDSVDENSFEISYKSPDHIHTIFEAGLQPYGEIIAFGAALDWLSKQKTDTILIKAKNIFDFLQNNPNITLINKSVTPVLSFYSDKLDAHLLAEALSRENIMVRSGYFCCHYYLDKKMHYPPLVRISLGHHNTDTDTVKLIEILERIFN